MLRIGQKVVCVRDRPQGIECRYATGRRSIKIKIGNIYTVRDIDFRAVHLHGVATLRVEEICNEVRETTVGPWEQGYPVSCFRPLQERKNDGESFVNALKDACASRRKEKERAPLENF